MNNSLIVNTELGELIADAGEVAGYLWEKGWAERNAGNISIDVTDVTDISDITGLMPAAAADSAQGTCSMPTAYAALAGRCFLVTGTGKRMRDLPKKPAAHSSLIRVAANGEGYVILGQGDFACRPTSELNSHLAIQQLLRQRSAPQTVVLHTHPNELVALTHLPAYAQEAALNRLLWSMHPETKIVIPEGVGLVPYRVPGSSQLEAATLQAMQGHRVALWEKHGAVAAGRDIFEAFDLIDTLNKSAQIFFLCMTAGSPPQGLTDAQVDELERTFGRQEGMSYADR